MTSITERVARAIAMEHAKLIDVPGRNLWVVDHWRCYAPQALEAIDTLKSEGYQLVPEGWVVVPLEANLEMLNAGHSKMFGDKAGPTSEVWAAMISAAPEVGE